MADIRVEQASEGRRLRIRDCVLASPAVHEFVISIREHRLTLGELIAERVRAECDSRQWGDGAAPLVSPGPVEAALNASASKERPVPDPEAEVAKALAAFEANGFVVLVDDRQVEHLESNVTVEPDTVVTFLRLVPLVGG
ncbi:MAG: hypothetical protein AAF968_18760 [Pseudomonadota bacterium]